MEEVIGVDIDGVILDFENTMRCLAELYDLLWLDKNGKINDEFSYLKQYDWSDEERKKFTEYFLVSATYKTPLIAFAKEVLTILKSMGKKIVIITARGGINKKTKYAVLEVLNIYGIPYDEIYFEQSDKVAIAKKLNIKYMIDDNPKTCEDLADALINVIYFRDKKSKIINQKQVSEVSNWGEVLRLFIDDKLDKDYAKKMIFKSLERK